MKDAKWMKTRAWLLICSKLQEGTQCSTNFVSVGKTHHPGQGASLWTGPDKKWNSSAQGHTRRGHFNLMDLLTKSSGTTARNCSSGLLLAPWLSLYCWIFSESLQMNLQGEASNQANWFQLPRLRPILECWELHLYAEKPLGTFASSKSCAGCHWVGFPLIQPSAWHVLQLAFLREIDTQGRQRRSVGWKPNCQQPQDAPPSAAHSASKQTPRIPWFSPQAAKQQRFESPCGAGCLTLC